MKGMFKRALAGIAAAALAATGLAMGAATANAALVTDCGTGDAACKVTLNADNGAQFTGHTYKAIKIADYDVYGTSPKQVFSLQTVDTIETQVTTAVESATGKDVPDKTDPLAWAQSQTTPVLDDSHEFPFLGNGTTRKFADALRDTIGTQATDVTPTVTDKQAVFTFTTPGLYLILDQNAVPATDKTNPGSSKSVPMLVGTPLTINENTVISDGTGNVKNQITTISKSVEDATVEYGKNAKYTLNTTIPNYVGYKVQGYTFTITDKFAANAPMEYVANSLHVYIAGNPETELIQGQDYSLTGFSNTSKTFTIDLSDYIKKSAFGDNEPTTNDTFTNGVLAGKAVRVVYEAKVTGSTGNTGVLNEPTIKYPNDPTTNESKDVPGPGVKVFNFDYTVQKKDRTTGASLQGATFVIYAEGGSATAPLQTVTTGADGTAKFTGLSDDVIYIIEETAAPTGYMDVNLKFKLDIDAVIEGANENATVESVTYKVTDDSLNLVSDGNTSTVTVENVKNITELPLTGAAGTMLFTVVGLLIAGAGALVYAKSRGVKRALRG